MTGTISIGTVASQTGVAVSALRYYDDIGLLSPAERVGGKRRFADEAVGRVNFIRRAQDAGFSLDEIRSILDDSRGEWRALVDDKVVELTTKRRELDEMIELLGEIRKCGCSAVATCSARPDWC